MLLASGSHAAGGAGAGDPGARSPGAGDPVASYEEGIADLTASPPARDEARRAFERASAPGGPAVTMSEAHFRLGVLDEEDTAFASALRHFRAAIALQPTSVWARAAQSRIRWISDRAEGEFAPLATLQRLRLDPAKAKDPAELDRLALAAAAFPPGRVRVEARILLASAWLKLPARREDALFELREIVADPHAGRKDARFAQRDLVAALLADGHLDSALEEVTARPLDPALGAEIVRLVHRRTLRHLAYAAAAGVLLAAMILGLRRRRRRRPAVPAAASPAAGAVRADLRS